MQLLKYLNLKIEFSLKKKKERKKEIGRTLSPGVRSPLLESKVQPTGEGGASPQRDKATRDADTYQVSERSAW